MRACERLARVVAAAMVFSGMAMASPALAAAQAAAGCGTTVAGGTLRDVAASSASNAWAVGYYPPAPTAPPLTDDQTLIEHWNGSAWCKVASPDPGGAARENQLLAVAVTSRSNAWAVGYYINASNIMETLVEHWNGHSWKHVASPDPAAPGMGNQLNDVAATSATDAWAVGTYVNASHVGRSLVLHWNGTRWRVVRFPGHSTNTELLGVVAGSATNVWVTGDYDTSTFFAQTLIEHWNGRAWTVTPTPNPAGTSNANYLQSLAVPSSSAALAVGSYFNSTSTLTFSARGNGRRWRTVATPNPGGTSNAVNGLTDVAAISAANAWAVGEYRQSGFSGPFQTLILHWAGTAWKRVASPDVTGQHNILYAVAATASSNAWAVGGLASTQTGLNLRTLILHWNGQTWTQMLSP
jgi:hypothetical protein